MGVKKSVTIAAPVALAGVSVTASVDTRLIKSLEGKPEEVKFEILAERIEELWTALPEKISNEAERRVQADNAEATTRLEAVRELCDLVRKSALGAIRVRGYGAPFILLGIVLATWWG